jgi:hypothetical protein
MADSRLKVIAEGLEGAALMALAIPTFLLLRGWWLRWGAADDEVKRTLPGDELAPNPNWGYTHAVTVNAPIAEVWPWIAQMGQGRGGFYSYQGLENLVGCDIYNADRIVPEWQDPQIGDEIRLHPKLGIPIAILEPGRALVLHALADMRTSEKAEPGQPVPQSYFNSIWMWYVEEIDSRTTRVISRMRSEYPATLGNRLMYGPLLIGPMSCVMSRKMLLGIKKRAERPSP